MHSLESLSFLGGFNGPLLRLAHSGLAGVKPSILLLVRANLDTEQLFRVRGGRRLIGGLAYGFARLLLILFLCLADILEPTLTDPCSLWRLLIELASFLDLLVLAQHYLQLSEVQRVLIDAGLAER